MNIGIYKFRKSYGKKWNILTNVETHKQAAEVFPLTREKVGKNYIQIEIEEHQKQ